jgi:hypothetical protein
MDSLPCLIIHCRWPNKISLQIMATYKSDISGGDEKENAGKENRA